MNIDNIIDEYFVKGNKTITDENKNKIIDLIYDLNKQLPIKEPYSKTELQLFNNDNLVLYLIDVIELATIRYFIKNGKTIDQYRNLI